MPNIKTSIFAVMTKLANEHGAVNLSQGFPDFQMPRELIKLTEKYMKKGFNQYSPMPGIMPLREMISAKMEALYAHKYNPETEITVTAGGTQALYSAITAIVNEGDEVIVFEPAYDSYVPVIKLNGGQPIYVNLKAPDYTIDWKEVNKLISSRTRLIIINTPHNPSGTVMSADDMIMLQKLVAGTKVLILSDEVYEHIIFDGKEHESVAKYPKLAERSIIVYSFGKVFHATGWKTGYCVAPEKIMSEFRKIHQFTVFSANMPIQYAIAEHLKDVESYITLPAFYEEKRNYFCNLLKQIGYNVVPSSGTYFQSVDFGDLIDEPDTELAVRLTKDFKIASIPMSAFYHDKVKSTSLRFCFAKEKDTMDMAAEKLLKFYNSTK